MLSLPVLIEPLFLAAGWQASTSWRGERLEPMSASQRVTAILREFGGLHVGECGPGTDQVASDVQFYTALRPDAAVVLVDWQRQVGHGAAFATAHRDHMILYVNHAGRYLAFTDPDSQLYDLGSEFGLAMQTLLWGRSFGPALARD